MTADTFVLMVCIGSICIGSFISFIILVAAAVVAGKADEARRRDLQGDELGIGKSDSILSDASDPQERTET